MVNGMLSLNLSVVGAGKKKVLEVFLNFSDSTTKLNVTGATWCD